MAAEDALNEAEKAQLTELIDRKNYAAQACFFMNAYWGEIQNKNPGICEEIYEWVHIFEKIDPEGKAGKKLNSQQAARVWEAIGETMTHIAMRNKLKEVDLDADGNMSVIEFLLCKDDADHFNLPCFNFDEMMKRPQGTNEAMERAIAKVTALVKIGEDDAAKEAAIRQEVEDTKGKVVKHNRAKNKLQTHLARDQTPYNQALITAEAAVRKAKKDKTTSAAGSDWWVDRDMAEAAKYKPPAKVLKN